MKTSHRNIVLFIFSTISFCYCGYVDDEDKEKQNQEMLNQQNQRLLDENSGLRRKIKGDEEGCKIEKARLSIDKARLELLLSSSFSAGGKVWVIEKLYQDEIPKVSVCSDIFSILPSGFELPTEFDIAILEREKPDLFLKYSQDEKSGKKVDFVKKGQTLIQLPALVFCLKAQNEPFGKTAENH